MAPENFLDSPALESLTRQLVAIPSMNPTLVDGDGTGESRVAEFAREWLERHGVRAWLEDAAPGRPNAVGEVGDPGAPALVLCAHLDTVGVAGMTVPPFDVTRNGDELHGRGTFDMKGAAAACMCAAAALAAGGFPGRVMLALVADEEYASLGAFDFVKRNRAAACILTEASDHELVLAHKGFVWARVTCRGRAAHGSRWDLGVSAIAKMARVVTALDDLDRNVLRRRLGALVGPASMHCGRIEGGVGLSTYSPSCEIRLERRYLPEEEEAHVIEEIRGTVLAADPAAEVEILLARPPFSCPSDSAIARCVRAASRAVRGGEPRDTGVAFWMDAAVFAASGIPTVDYGPSGAGAHEDDEWVSLVSITECARVYHRAAIEFAKTQALAGGAR